MQHSALILLAGLVGVVHVLAPDHWLPASVVSWQKRWSTGRVIGFAVTAFSLHAFLGLLLFFALVELFGGLYSNPLLIFTVLLVGSVAVIRLTRFSRIKEVLRGGPESRWGLFAVISLLGPAESLIPLMIEARHLGAGYLAPFLAYWAGTVVSGFALMVTGRAIWDRPWALPSGLRWAHRIAPVAPILSGVLLGLSASIR